MCRLGGRERGDRGLEVGAGGRGVVQGGLEVCAGECGADRGEREAWRWVQRGKLLPGGEVRCRVARR